VSLHSLTYTRPELEIFNTKKKRDDLLEYLVRFCDVAGELKCKNVVFGSPKSRMTYGKEKEELNDVFAEFLVDVDRRISNVYFNIEPLSVEYCGFLNEFSEGVGLLETLGLKQVFVQLDVRTVIENNEKVNEIFKYQSFIKHVHVSNPGLRVPGVPYRKTHDLVRLGLRKMGYEGFITAEVVAQTGVAKEELLDKIIDSMRTLYGE